MWGTRAPRGGGAQRRALRMYEYSYAVRSSRIIAVLLVAMLATAVVARTYEQCCCRINAEFIGVGNPYRYTSTTSR